MHFFSFSRGPDNRIRLDSRPSYDQPVTPEAKDQKKSFIKKIFNKREDKFVTRKEIDLHALNNMYQGKVVQPGKEEDLLEELFGPDNPLSKTRA